MYEMLLDRDPTSIYPPVGSVLAVVRRNVVPAAEGVDVPVVPHQGGPGPPDGEGGGGGPAGVVGVEVELDAVA